VILPAPPLLGERAGAVAPSGFHRHSNLRSGSDR